ncbi:polysaccharide export protein [Zoogloea sp.]|uniref:polysaccharide export protein n=1 Tax=Zoogloea sp. TaxID=49181 RepID=UPI002614F450|nr:polysaccharide export protein [Zoogloea sp.]MDD3352749.1 polysaccharide export protein [Zoogloea sp.]
MKSIPSGLRARVAAPRQRLVRPLLLAALCASLGACALVPGDKAYGLRDSQSAVRLPTRSADGAEPVPANVAIRPITAELIIEQMTKAAAERPTATDTNISGRGGKGGVNPVTAPDYKVGPGDVLTIIVWDHPELTTPAGQYRSADQAGTVVNEDGTIYYPYVGTLQVAGKTTRQIRELLSVRLAKFIEKVQLDVRMAAFRSKRVYVVGEVAKPGQLEITDIPMTVLEAVNRAGGFGPEADHSRVLLTRKGTTYRVDIQAMYEAGATEQNALLEHGDILNVQDRSFNKIFVLGEVQKPGSLVMTKKRSTLAEALADTGYIAQEKANPKWIYVMRGESDTPELFHLDGSSPDAMLLADRFPLRPRDIVYVDAADVVRWNRVITNVLPTAQTLFQISGTRYPLFGGRNP